LDETLDINGWDLKKALQLLYGSNPTIFEWCASPVVYLEQEGFSAVRNLLPQYFSVKKSLFHYWHMAESNYRKYLKEDMVRVKKYLYVLRPLLAAKWVLDRKTAPPMLFEELLDAELEEELRPEVEKLLNLKKTLPEIGLTPKIQRFNDYIDRSMPIIKGIAEGIYEKKHDWEPLDRVFYETIR
ncbi:MAG: nucleotidyltransferase domain-containing protein, partial [Bacillota bacterium]|nr:nucleotidyltransferase domain-containing protein [Bacillota bacterium]